MPGFRFADKGVQLNEDSASQDFETRSASVDLQDIIENFDESSQKSVLTKSNSISNLRQYSQSYFTASAYKDEETTSFYSALQDGFPLDQDEGYSEHRNGSEFLWAAEDSSKNPRLSPPTNFQVFWHDIIYRIEPKIKFGNAFNGIEQIFSNSLLAFSRVVCGSSRSFQIGRSDCDNPLGKKEPLTIIQQISGSFRSGELTAVMGPSGAGKTSLMNFLSRRREEGYSGHLYVEDAQRRIKISTIPQHDYLPGYLTVRENLLFASRLKNTTPKYDHLKNVEKVSNLLGLDDCLDTRTKKISGGQHKRLAIAQELLSKPDILILDEPTSGLDSLTCYKTISVLKDLVKSSERKLIDPIAIVLTIHQPQQEVFDIFDKIYVMANGGSVIYEGPPNKCTEFVQKHSGLQMPDIDYNPASFLIEIASGEFGSGPVEALKAQVRFDFMNKMTKSPTLSAKLGHKLTTHKTDVDMFKTEHIHMEESTEQEALTNDSWRKFPLHIDQLIAKGSSMNRGHFWLKTRILTHRCWISMIRDPKQVVARIIFHIILPLILALIMGSEPGRSTACPKFSSEYNLKDIMNNDHTSGDVQEELMMTLENTAFLFVMIYALSSANIGAITLSFAMDLQSSLKEFYNGWYSMSSYILARLITELPMVIILPIVTLSIGYPLSGQLTGIGDIYRISITALAIILGSMIGQTFGMIFGAIYIGHVSTALFAAQGATLPLIFISGFVVRTKNMSKLIYALSNISFYRHTLEIAMIARYGFNVCGCDPKSISGEDAKLIGVTDKLKSFTQFWLSSYGSPVSDDARTIQDRNDTTNANQVDDDIFKLFAKQISLYNTYGIDVKSCSDVVPYQIHDLSLNENHLPTAFLALVISLIIIQLLLFLTVKLVIKFRTSL